LWDRGLPWIEKSVAVRGAQRAFLQAVAPEEINAALSDPFQPVDPGEKASGLQALDGDGDVGARATRDFGDGFVGRKAKAGGPIGELEQEGAEDGVVLGGDGAVVLAFFDPSHERAAARHEPGSKISVELSWLLEAGEYFCSARAQMRRQRLRCRHGISVGVWSPGRSARMQAKTDHQQKRGFRLT